MARSLTVLALFLPTMLFAQANPILSNPAGNQTITQPSGTTLAVNSLNTVLYASPTSGVDLVTQVNTLFSACNFVCEVHIPAGTYNSTGGTIQMNHATQSLSGDGKDKVLITYSGSNFIDYEMLNSGSFGTSFSGSKGISGFTINCTNSAAVCIRAGSLIGLMVQDLTMIGPGGAVSQGSAGTSQAFQFQNVAGWMERWTLRNLIIGGFANNLHFMAPTGNGTSSFGYGLVDGVTTNQGANSQGVLVDPGASVYNFLGWKYQYNFSGPSQADGSSIFNVGGFMTGVGFDVTGENQGTPYTFAHILCGGNMQVTGGFRGYGFAGPLMDCPNTGGNGLPPFWVGPLMSRSNMVAGLGTLTNYNGNSDTFRVLPLDILGVDTPTGGQIGYVYGTLGESAPYVAFDYEASFCMNTHFGYYPLALLNQVWCADGNGNSTQNGNITAKGGITAASLTSSGAVNAASVLTTGNVSANGSLASGGGFSSGGNISIGGSVQAAGGYKVQGSTGYTGTVDTTSCKAVFTITGGIITAVSCSN